MEKILFIGPLGGDDAQSNLNGATIKNKQLVEKLKSLNVKVECFNTQEKRSLVRFFNQFIRILPSLFKCKIVISTSYKGAYFLIKLLSRLQIKNKIFYWVIGGALAEKIVEDRLNTRFYSKISKIIVEGDEMLINLQKLNIQNLFHIPNLRKIPQLQDHPFISSNEVKFLFLSRITPEKGCDLIFEACNLLKNGKYAGRYSVSFFGPIDERYKPIFFEKIKQFKNVSYQGCINLTNINNYEKLQEYQVLLFPTFWPTEGFPGVCIDGFILGIPTIASDWNLNSTIIEDGKTGYIIPPRDGVALANRMAAFIDNPDLIRQMRINCKEEAQKYDIDRIITKNLLQEIGLIDQDSTE